MAETYSMFPVSGARQRPTRMPPEGDTKMHLVEFHHNILIIATQKLIYTHITQEQRAAAHYHYDHIPFERSITQN